MKKGYARKCLIGTVEENPKLKYGVLYTSDKWKSVLDRVWRFLGSESSIPVDTSENERYYIIYTAIKDLSIRIAFIAGIVAIYLIAMKGCVV